MEIILCAVEENLCAAWERECENLPQVRVHHGSIFDITADALVSPSNSFGFMDGGIDYHIAEFLGNDIQDHLRAVIAEDHCGELLVGQAEILRVDNPSFTYLISAPTMRMPEALPANTVNPYLAMRAVLNLICYGSLCDDSGEVPIGDLITSIAVPGMGTGTGEVSHTRCARQMAQAIMDVCNGDDGMPADWDEAADRYQSLQVS